VYFAGCHRKVNSHKAANITEWTLTVLEA
jgi:hypothetical protein